MGTPEIVVVGAGVVGAHVAYRLAWRGARVTVLDAESPGGGASGTSFAWINAFAKTPRDYHALNRGGMDEYAGLAAELGGVGWLHQQGCLHWQATLEGQAGLRRTVERLAAWQYPAEILSPRQARELEPDLCLGPQVEELVFAAREGYVDVVPCIAALLAGARRHGARVLSDHRVSGVVREGDRIRGVVTDAGVRVDADVVVDCAGTATDEVARLAGVTVPLERVPGRLIYTTPVATTLRRPVQAPDVHFRPDGGGRIVLATVEHDGIADRDDPSWTPERSLATAVPHLPALAGARVEAVRIGVRPMPRDRMPIVGSFPGLEGFYVIVSHSGVTLGPLWGRVAVAEILDRTPDPRLDGYRPTRFGETP